MVMQLVYVAGLPLSLLWPRLESHSDAALHDHVTFEGVAVNVMWPPQGVAPQYFSAFWMAMGKGLGVYTTAWCWWCGRE